MERRVIENWYIKDTGDGRDYMSGMAIPRDADGITRNIAFSRCDWHYASYGIFENCTDNSFPIPNGPCHVRYYLDLSRPVKNVLLGGNDVLTDEQKQELENYRKRLS